MYARWRARVARAVGIGPPRPCRRGRGGSTTCRGSAPDVPSVGREVGPHDRAEVADDRHPPRGRARCPLAGRKRRAQDPGPAAVDGHVRGSLARQPALGQQRPRAPAGMEQRREAVVAGLRRAQRGWVVAPLVVGAIALEPGAGAARCPPRRRIGARAGLAQRDAVIGREHLDGAPRSQRQRQPLRCQHVPAALAGRRGEALPHRGAGDGRRRGGAPERRLQDAPPAALDRQRERRRVLRDGRSERASGRTDRPVVGVVAGRGRPRERGGRDQGQTGGHNRQSDAPAAPCRRRVGAVLVHRGARRIGRPPKHAAGVRRRCAPGTGGRSRIKRSMSAWFARPTAVRLGTMPRSWASCGTSPDQISATHSAASTVAPRRARLRDRAAKGSAQRMYQGISQPTQAIDTSAAQPAAVSALSRRRQATSAHASTPVTSTIVATRRTVGVGAAAAELRTRRGSERCRSRRAGPGRARPGGGGRMRAAPPPRARCPPRPPRPRPRGRAGPRPARRPAPAARRTP